MGLVYYRAVRERSARRRMVIRKAALEAERILQVPPDYSLRCERPGCGHPKKFHLGNKGGCCGIIFGAEP